MRQVRQTAWQKVGAGVAATTNPPVESPSGSGNLEPILYSFRNLLPLPTCHPLSHILISSADQDRLNDHLPILPVAAAHATYRGH